jgi:hypothetical protein
MSMPGVAMFVTMIVRMGGMTVAVIGAMVVRMAKHAPHSTRKKAGAAIGRAY